MPPKTKLTVASSEPVSLDESTNSSDAKPELKDSSPVTEADNKETEKKDTAAPEETPNEQPDKIEEVDLNSKPKESEKEAAPEPPSKDEPEENAPPQPARPVSALAKMQADLKEAFPQVEEKYIKAFLIASEGRIDPAFNALLSLSDPNFTPDPIVPQVKETPKAAAPQALTDDELLARQLQKEFNREERRRQAALRERNRPAAPADTDDESPDEIDQLKEQFAQGFEEAKTTLNGWVSGLTKKFSELEGPSSDKKSSPKLFGALGGSSFNSDKEERFKKFDEDPEILSSDFSRNVNLNEERPPSLPKRKQKSQDERWQPLNSDVPVNPDAFLVTDSEEEDKK